MRLQLLLRLGDDDGDNDIDTLTTMIVAMLATRRDDDSLCFVFMSCCACTFGSKG